MAVSSFTVNGQSCQVDVDPDKPLLWVLRENCGLTGTKFGCGISMCGACTVLIGADEKTMFPVRSCGFPAAAVQNKFIKTIEGLSTALDLAVQKAWIDEDVPQCGYCQSGQIMATVALLESVRKQGRALTDQDIDTGLSGNLCRCGTYVRIRKAVKAAASKLGFFAGDTSRKESP